MQLNRLWFFDNIYAMESFFVSLALLSIALWRFSLQLFVVFLFYSPYFVECHENENLATF